MNIIHKIISKIFFKLENISYQVKYQNFRNKYSLSNSMRFNGNHILLYGDGEIIIGEDTYIGSFSSIQSFKGCRVTIGSNCSISHYLKIYTMNNVAKDVIENKDVINKNTGNVVIGDNCWIGVNVFIKEGVSIGNNCVIGANSVVTKDIPNNKIYTGNKL